MSDINIPRPDAVAFGHNSVAAVNVVLVGDLTENLSGKILDSQHSGEATIFVDDAGSPYEGRDRTRDDRHLGGDAGSA